MTEEDAVAASSEAGGEQAYVRVGRRAHIVTMPQQPWPLKRPLVGLCGAVFVPETLDEPPDDVPHCLECNLLEVERLWQESDRLRAEIETLEAMAMELHEDLERWKDTQ